MTDPTDAPREAVRPATECYLVQGGGRWFATSMLRGDQIEPEEWGVLALAVDNVTGGGIAARVRLAIAHYAYDLHADAHLTHADMDRLSVTILAALGIATTTEPRHD